MELIERKEYLDFLIKWREKQIVKVVSGVRRCGKSTLFEIYINYLIKSGINDSQIISINFEDAEYDSMTDYKTFYEYIKTRMHPSKMNFIFLDEIQHLEKFEKAVDSLFIKTNCDVYITGSNAYFMSGDLATLLSGRYIELKMLTLSFSEFYSGLTIDNNALSIKEGFDLYIENGSFPYVLKFGMFGKHAKDYLHEIYNSVLLKDIVKRLNISDVASLENIAKFMFSNIGSRVSSNKIANTLKSVGKGVDQKTVDKYIRGLTDSLMFYGVNRYNIKGRQFLTSNSKYYAVDVGLRNTLVKGKETDIGHILENIVFLELKRRGYEVYIGQLDSTEVDFVVETEKGIEYYQVSATTLDENTLIRELLPLKNINDNYPKYLLTLDEIQKKANYNGIIKMHILDWLLK